MRISAKMYNMIRIPVDASGMGILLLGDLEETRTLAIACDDCTYNFFYLHYCGEYQEITSRAIPRVLWGILKEKGPCNFEIDIKDLVDGEYDTDLVSLDTGKRYPMRVTDALFLAHIGELPIYINDDLLAPASGPEEFQVNSVASILKLIETPLLEEMLESVLEREDYEMASKIRDELNARKEQSPTD